MTREAIALNGDKVRFRIAELAIPRKQLLYGRSPKTLQRILRGENTSLSTAHQLARELGTTLEEITGPVKEDDLSAWLPERWLYEDGPATKLENHASSMSFVGAGMDVSIDCSPIVSGNPLAKLLAFRSEICRKIVVRRAGETFEIEVHYFDYVDRGRKVAYQFGVSCRFFPLSRDGDNFLKVALSGSLKRHFWTWLRATAFANAELLEIEGYQFPAHPHQYRPLAIFSKGHADESTPGVRLFSQLQVDFRQSLIEYLDSLDRRKRVFAQATHLGISITVEPTIKEMITANQFSPTTIEVRLVWSTSTGSLRPAPWRYDHRQEFAAAITERRWRDFHSRGMPIRQFSADLADDPPAPPMSADRDIPAEQYAAIRCIDWYDFDEQL